MLDNFIYKQRSKIWRFQGNLDARLTRLRFRNKRYTHIPFYDRRKNVYRCFFDDRYDEEGGLAYVVGEYINDGLIYHYKQRGEYVCEDGKYHYKNTGVWHVDHEHSFSGILEVITTNRGKGFSIKGFESEYSQQELNIINKYIRQLKKDTKRY